MAVSGFKRGYPSLRILNPRPQTPTPKIYASRDIMGIEAVAFRVWGLGFGVYSLGFGRVWGLGVRRDNDMVMIVGAPEQ